MGDEARFWDRHAEGYEKSPVADEESYQKKLRDTQALMQPDMEVLEFGCGTGSTALVHASHVKQILATDISGGMLDIARAKADAAGVTNVTFEQASIETFTAPDESFDMVLGLSILHLLKDKEAVMAKVFRMLKPGGLFVSSTICMANGYSIFKVLGPIGKAVGLLPHLGVFTRDELADSLIHTGFALEQEWRPGPKKAVFIIARKPDTRCVSCAA